ncbi:hypothetical protein QFZ34_001266 [Phyllobacterium ifriqiyense]|uniref:Uncharacterized protein n=1 Tax=Phyllobacterium ifriqiyense TaxID=314238 RepID=A0ABU0S5S3_9HYPH|nr:hypothetical protein [Phyllobacterium ifriqiyense]
MTRMKVTLSNMAINIDRVARYVTALKRRGETRKGD